MKLWTVIMLIFPNVRIFVTLCESNLILAHLLKKLNFRSCSNIISNGDFEDTDCSVFSDGLCITKMNSVRQWQFDAVDWDSNTNDNVYVSNYSGRIYPPKGQKIYLDKCAGAR
jgi:hypothetical protein